MISRRTKGFVFLPSIVILALLCLLFPGLSFAASIGLAWNPSSESNVAGYYLYIGTQAGVYSTRINAGNTTEYTVTNLEAGQFYYLSVSAYDFLDNESSLSQEIVVPIPSFNPQVDQFVLYGEPADVVLGLMLQAMEVLDPTHAATGQAALKLSPTPWHTPMIWLMHSVDISTYDQLQFSIKATIPGQSLTLRLTDGGAGSGPTLTLNDYISGGSIPTSYTTVTIPLEDLSNSTFDLTKVQSFVFGTNDKASKFYVDDMIVLTNPTPPPPPPPSTNALTLYGEPEDVGLGLLLQAAQINDPSQAATGQFALRLTPTQWHTPMAWLAHPVDLSTYGTLQFLIKASAPGQSLTLQLTDGGASKGPAVTLNEYMEGGIIPSDYGMVSIPLDALMSPSFSLTQVQTLVFGVNSQGAKFYVDDIVVIPAESLSPPPPPPSPPLPPPPPDADALILYGEPEDVGVVFFLQAGELFDPTQASTGEASLRLSPTLWHTPIVWLAHSVDLTSYATLQFSIKSSLPNQTFTLQLKASGGSAGPVVSLNDFIEDGTISTTYTTVSIPLAVLSSASLTLKDVHSFSFGTNAEGAEFFVDDIHVVVAQEQTTSSGESGDAEDSSEEPPPPPPNSDSDGSNLPEEQPEILTLYGEPTDVGLGLLVQASEVSDSTQAATGQTTIHLTPTPSNTPRVWLAHSVDLSTYGTLQFSLRATVPGQTLAFHLMNGGTETGTSINLNDYIDGGTIPTTYGTVTIPLSVLTSSTLDLAQIQTLVFGVNSEGAEFFVDDIQVLQGGTPLPPPAPSPPPPSEPDSLLLYGEPDDVGYLLLLNVTEISDSTQAATGEQALELTPTFWHQPQIFLSESIDLLPYETLEFSLKAENAGQSLTVQLTDGGFTAGPTVSINDFIQGGAITTNYNTVSIPLSSLTTGPNVSLDTGRKLVFGHNSQEIKFYLDDVRLVESHNP